MTDKIPDGMPPGAWGWPVTGKMLSTSSSFPAQVHMLKEKYGKIFTWRIGSSVFVFLNDCRLVKEAFNNAHISGRVKGTPFSFMVDFHKAGITNTDGKVSTNLRRFSLRYFKNNGMGKSSLEDFVLYEAQCLVENFQKYVDRPTKIPWSINVAVINILWKIVTDKRYELEDKEILHFERLMTSLLKGCQTPKFLIFTFFPWLFQLIPNYVIRTMLFKEHFNKFNIYRGYFEECIRKHKQTFEGDEPGFDFVNAFLGEISSNKNGKNSEKVQAFTDENLLYSLSNLFGAGSETTSSTIRWLILFMVKHEDIQKKLQTEIDKVVPRCRLPSLSDREKLPYLEAVIHEVMRFKPIVPLGVFHRTSQETTIGKYRIPKETIVVSNITECHFDSDYWKNPEEFLPERFLLSDGSFNSNCQSFIPFSVGKRECIGKAFANIELYIFIGALLQKFTFKPSNREDLDEQLGSSMNVISIPEPIKIIISERL